MQKSEFLKALVSEISEEEKELLQSGEGLTLSAFHKEAMLRMLDTFARSGSGEVLPIIIGEVSERRDQVLIKNVTRSLKDRLTAEDYEKEAKWIMLADRYLTFIEEVPMHPVDEKEIDVTKVDEKGADGTGERKTVYLCPSKEVLPTSPCYSCVCKRMSNYEITRRRIQKLFADYDHEKMAEKFGLQLNSSFLYIRSLDRMFRISRTTGETEYAQLSSLAKTDAETLDYIGRADINEVMTLMDILCDSKDNCRASGDYTLLPSLANVSQASNYAGVGLMKNMEETMVGKSRELAEALKMLFGVPAGDADVGYDIPIFDFLKVRIQFWEGDEDFEASFQVFCDKNTLQFMKYETVWYMTGYLSDRIRAKMGMSNYTKRQ